MDNASVKGVGNTVTKIAGKGTVTLKFDLRQGRSNIHKLKNVLHLPTAGNCFLSISKLAESRGYAEFANKTMSLKAKGGKVIGTGQIDHDLYILKAQAMLMQEHVLSAKNPNKAVMGRLALEVWSHWLTGLQKL